MGKRDDVKTELSNIMRNRMRRCLWVGVVSGFLPVAGYGQPELFDQGITLDTDGTTILNSNPAWPNTDRNNVQLGASAGALLLFSGIEESGRGVGDGGVAIGGSPISLVLTGSSPGNQGSFGVWSVTQFSGTPGGKPYFQINDGTQDAIFDEVDVKVVNGSLSVGGSPVVTAGGLNTALSTATPPTSAAWKAAYVPRGNVSNGGAFATGAATASGTSSVAHGPSQTVASGAYSHAAGAKAVASGTSSTAIGSDAYAAAAYSIAHGSQANAWEEYAFAHGYSVYATGKYSTVIGRNAAANSYAETVLGRFNKGDSSANAVDWAEADALFRIGNGTDPEPSGTSDAVTVRKNGETTLTNKAWKDYGLGLEEPSVPDAAEGRALVVDGHTLLNGKVTITEPQGDISMGIYQ